MFTVPQFVYISHFLLGEDFRREIQRQEKSIYQSFIKDDKMPFYDTGRFYDFCRSANAGNVFNFIWSSITTACHSKGWVELNKKQEGALYMSFVFATNVRWFTKGRWSIYEVLPDDRWGYQYATVIGTLICSRSIKRQITESLKTSKDLFDNTVKDAIKNSLWWPWWRMTGAKSTPGRNRWKNISSRQFLHHCHQDHQRN